MLVAPAAIAAPAHSAVPVKHTRGCRTRACDERIARWLLRWEQRHRPAGSLVVASYFGGGSGACGGGSWGVASKTLACGTRLRICAARCVQASVTDRGPYVEGRELDLTEEVARAVGAAPWEGGFSMGAGVGTVRVSLG